MGFNAHSIMTVISRRTFFTNKDIVQELCESRGGRPGLSVLTSLLVSMDVKDLLNHALALVTACP